MTTMNHKINGVFLRGWQVYVFVTENLASRINRDCKTGSLHEDLSCLPLKNIVPNPVIKILSINQPL